MTIKRFLLIGYWAHIIFSQTSGTQSSFSRIVRAGKIVAGATVGSHLYLTYGNRPFNQTNTLDDLNIYSITPVCQEKSLKKTSLSLDRMRKIMSQNDHEQLTKSILCINDRKLTIHKNIIESYTGTIVIYVSGLLLIPSLDGQKTPLGLKTASTIIGAHVTDISPWIIFAMPGQKDRKAFTFGQEPDQYDLNRVIKAVVQKNPAANIILMGTCLGSTTILNYLANPTYNSQQYFNAIKSAILESPAISFDNIQKHITTQLSYLLRPAMFWILSKYYPKYTKEKDTENILTSYQRIPVHISFLIGYSKHDAITSSKETKLIAEYLQKNGINVLLFENKNPKTAHGDLKYNIYFHKAIKSFISE